MRRARKVLRLLLLVVAQFRTVIAFISVLGIRLKFGVVLFRFQLQRKAVIGFLNLEVKVGELLV
jgi:hypothetical protein